MLSQLLAISAKETPECFEMTEAGKFTLNKIVTEHYNNNKKKIYIYICAWRSAIWARFRRCKCIGGQIRPPLYRFWSLNPEP